MTTNRERIENLEAGFGAMQDGLHQMELDMADKLHHLEETLNRLSDVLFNSKESSNRGNQDREGHNCFREEDEWRHCRSPESAHGSLPLGRRSQSVVAVDPQNIPRGRACSLLGDFEDELWARFGPLECDDFDEALSIIRQTGSLRDYQREFERLGNRVRGWTQKALVGTFMGGLNTEISYGIRMFKPQTLKDAISLARMKDDQFSRQRCFLRPPPSASPSRSPTRGAGSSGSSQCSCCSRLEIALG
ncbi:hypothetical protein F0562_006114 [Nyssa sinensis]|uniref:Retrotransposon gag domain-containing protein n=1 Tax=Nyssa sinensis TaxID=561372 RepID=A0A5J5AL09_9ASTE|nr:hypothetical protein F0562_006114 [Nyssa sinensis]